MERCFRLDLLFKGNSETYSISFLVKDEESLKILKESINTLFTLFKNRSDEVYSFTNNKDNSTFIKIDEIQLLNFKEIKKEEFFEEINKEN